MLFSVQFLANKLVIFSFTMSNITQPFFPFLSPA
jgi:hypothetical protein